MWLKLIRKCTQTLSCSLKKPTTQSVNRQSIDLTHQNFLPVTANLHTYITEISQFFECIVEIDLVNFISV